MLEPNAFWLYYKGILNICYPTSDLKTPMLANLIVSRAAYFEVVVPMVAIMKWRSSADGVAVAIPKIDRLNI